MLGGQRLVESRYQARAADKSGSRLNGYLRRISDVKVSDLAFLKAEDVLHRFVLQPVRLIMEGLTFEIADRLLNLHDNRAVRNLIEANGLDVRAYNGPLTCPVFSNGLAAVNVTAVHNIGPSDIIGNDGKNTVDVSCVEAIIHALENFYVTVHWDFLLLAWRGARWPRTRALSALAVEIASGGKSAQTSLHDVNARLSIHCVALTSRCIGTYIQA